MAAVWDNLGSNCTLSGGNLIATASSSGADGIVRSTAAITAKTYIELTQTTVVSQRPTSGLANTSETTTNTANSCCWNVAFGIFINSVDVCPGFGGGVSGDILGIAVNPAISRAWFRKNGGSWFPSGGDPATNTGGVDISSLGTVYAYAFLSNVSDVLTANFGGSAYSFTAPSGFSALSGIATGTAAITLGALSASAAGAVQVHGASSVTLGALTAASTGAVKVSGAAAATLGALGLSATVAPVSITGVASITLGALTLAAIVTDGIWSPVPVASESWSTVSASPETWAPVSQTPTTWTPQ